VSQEDHLSLFSCLIVHCVFQRNLHSQFLEFFFPFRSRSQKQIISSLSQQPRVQLSPSKHPTFRVAATHTRRHAPCWTARRACLIDIDTWVSFFSKSVSFQTRALCVLIHPLFLGRLPTSAPHQQPSSTAPHHGTTARTGCRQPRTFRLRQLGKD